MIKDPYDKLFPLDFRIMPTPIILSKTKFEELKKEFHSLNKTLRHEQEANLGVVHESYREASADEIVLKAKESRVNELQKIISTARILKDGEVDVATGIGKEIDIKFPDGTIKRMKLVHPIESEPSKNLLSVESPLAKGKQIK